VGAFAQQNEKRGKHPCLQAWDRKKTEESMTKNKKGEKGDAVFSHSPINENPLRKAAGIGAKKDSPRKRLGKGKKRSKERGKWRIEY